MDTIRIRSIRFGAEITKISFEERTSDEQWIHTSIESPEMPRKEFVKAMDELAEDVCIINEYDGHIAGLLDITGCTFRYAETPNDYKVVIIAKRKVKISNSPVNITTPLVSLEKLDENDENYQFKTDLKKKLADVMHYATKYVKGDRETSTQPSLRFTDGEEEEEEESDE